MPHLPHLFHKKNAPAAGTTAWPSAAGTTTSTTNSTTTTVGTEQVVSGYTAAVAPQVMFQERAPIIHEKIMREEVEEIQPIIHRDHERTEIHQVTQPIVEESVRAVEIVQKELPSQVRATVIAGPQYVASTEVVQNTVQYQQDHKVVEKPPIYMESEHRTVIEEVQPVLYKEILQPSLVKETLPIYEKIIEPFVLYHETRPVQYLGATATSTATTTATAGMVSGHGHHHQAPVHGGIHHRHYEAPVVAAPYVYPVAPTAVAPTAVVFPPKEVIEEARSTTTSRTVERQYPPM